MEVGSLLPACVSMGLNSCPQDQWQAAAHAKASHWPMHKIFQVWESLNTHLNCRLRVKLIVLHCTGQICLNGLGMGQCRRCILVRNSRGSLSVPTGTCVFLGEGIVRNELFLFFTAILQNFSLSSPVAPEDIDLTPKKSGFAKIPPMYQICFLHRGLC